VENGKRNDGKREKEYWKKGKGMMERWNDGNGTKR
jgi:hypothetical protein